MRFILLLLTPFIFLNGCGQKTDRSQTTTGDSSTTPARPEETANATSQPDTVCFRQVVGRDSTTLRLVINDSIVMGELAVLPFEKDRARGPIEGKLAGTQIKATWQRSGEGVTQDYEVTFTVKGDAVTWREGERIEKQGKWVLKNPAQGYEYVLTKIDCP